MHTFRLLFLALALAIPPISAQSAATIGTTKVIGLEQSALDRFKLDATHSSGDIAAQLLHALEQSGYLLATVTRKNNILYVDLGHISLVTITGLQEKTQALAHTYLQQALMQTPTISKLDHALALINDIAGVSASFAFEHLAESGEYELVVSATESRQFGAISFDSTPRNLFQQNRVTLQQDIYNTLTGGDIVRFQGVYLDGDSKPEQHSILGSYQIPLGSSGAYTEISLGDIQSETFVRSESSAAITNTGFTIIPGTVTNHDFEGQTASLTLGYPIYRQHDRATYILGNIDYSSDKTEAVGEVNNWAAETSLFQHYHRPTGETFALGTTVGGGHTNSYLEEDDGDFAYFQAGLGYIHPLRIISPNTEMRAEAFGQIASVNTPNAKTIGLGATDMLRGYESSTFTGTSGGAATLELAHAYHFLNDYIYRITPFIFSDIGYVSNPSKKQNLTTRPDHDMLASAGAGAHLFLAYNLQMSSYVGIPLARDYLDETPSPAGYLKMTWSW